LRLHRDLHGAVGFWTLIVFTIVSFTGVYIAFPNPVASLIQAINAPLLDPVRRRMPLLGGIDLSPLVVILGLQVLSMLVMPLLLGTAYPQY